MLDKTKCILIESDGINLFPDYLDFKYLEVNPILDNSENFYNMHAFLHKYMTEHFTLQEREKCDFDAFSLLEFLKIRKKFMNFLYVMAFALEIYRL